MHEVKYVFECDNTIEKNISKPTDISLCLHKSNFLKSRLTCLNVLDRNFEDHMKTFVLAYI